MTGRKFKPSGLHTRLRDYAWLAASVIVLSSCLSILCDSIPTATAQRRTRRAPASSRKPAIDYSKFSHVTDKHRGECISCHKMPTKNWQRVRDYPDVSDFPDHDACVSCHRRQFFRGANPQICTVCHLKSSPRDDKRYAFRNPSSARQFSIEFPHDKHQDVIATLERQFTPRAERSYFQRVSFRFSENNADEPGKVYNNCSICHEPLKAAPPTPGSGWPDAFVPDAPTFKSVPLNHSSCFNCHWKSQPPIRTDCAGCHKPETPHLGVSVVKRISMKFRHAREQHVAECTTCHINITKSVSLRGLTPDVPITSCTECHNKAGLRLDVANELEAIDRNRDFVCVYCHTSDSGRKDPPASHYLISGREPLKRKDIK